MIFKCFWLHFPSLSLFLYSQTLKADEVTVGSVLLVTALPVLFSSHTAVVAAGWAALHSSYEFQFSSGKPFLTKCPPDRGQKSSSVGSHHSPQSKGWRKEERCSRTGQFWSKPDFSAWMSDGDMSCEPFSCTTMPGNRRHRHHSDQQSQGKQKENKTLIKNNRTEEMQMKTNSDLGIEFVG